MFSTEDTIVAIATPLGRSGVGVVRLSGPEASRIAGELANHESPFEPRHATFCRLATRPPSLPATSVPASDLRPSREPPPASSPVEGSLAGRSASPRPRRRVASPDAAVRDQVVVVWFPAPKSYTGEDVVEISAHGSPVVLREIVRAAVRGGARLAEPGEFTLRAFLHGKLDLVQAEAVADLIDAVTPLQARAAFDQLEGTLTTAIALIEAELFDLSARLEASLDFPDEGYHFVEPGEAGAAIARVRQRIDHLLADAARGRMVREGVQVAIVGAPNVGKSSLFNALLHANRAIVTAIPGTTRDLLTERADVRGLSIALVDTAGIRDTSDVVEQEGVLRARQAAEVADLVLVILDRSRPASADDEALVSGTAARRRLIVLNKTDLPAQRTAPADAGDVVHVSVKTGDGLDALADRMAAILGASEERRDQPLVTNIRHAALLERARESLTRAFDAVNASNGTMPEEFLLADLQEAAAHLQEITGRRSTEDLLRHIFERFCIGK